MPETYQDPGLCIHQQQGQCGQVHIRKVFF
jgi:hypothetical protein